MKKERKSEVDKEKYVIAANKAYRKCIHDYHSGKGKLAYYEYMETLKSAYKKYLGGGK